MWQELYEVLEPHGLVMLAIAVLPLWRLRAVEHHLGVAGRLEPIPDA